LQRVDHQSRAGLIFTDLSSGPGRAIGPVCVSVCLSGLRCRNAP